MVDDDGGLPVDRRSPVGAPVIRGDAAITGEHAEEAVEFDPDDPESLSMAANTVRDFANGVGEANNLYILRGAAACAALVRGEGSYKAASSRANGVPVTFIRKWARVHDLPRAIRIHVAKGDIPPTAAKHIARVAGPARYHLAWALLDHDLTVREVRAIASEVNDGVPVTTALERNGVTPGAVTIELPLETYRELRRRAAIMDEHPGEIIAEAIEDYYDLTAE